MRPIGRHSNQLRFGRQRVMCAVVSLLLLTAVWSAAAVKEPSLSATDRRLVSAIDQKLEDLQKKVRLDDGAVSRSVLDAEIKAYQAQRKSIFATAKAQAATERAEQLERAAVASRKIGEKSRDGHRDTTARSETKPTKIADEMFPLYTDYTDLPALDRPDQKAISVPPAASPKIAVGTLALVQLEEDPESRPLSVLVINANPCKQDQASFLVRADSPDEVLYVFFNRAARMSVLSEAGRCQLLGHLEEVLDPAEQFEDTSTRQTAKFVRE